MNRSLVLCSAFALFTLGIGRADASRSVTDQNGTKTLSGYCDLNGDDCIATPLGFTVSLGGATYDSFVVYGNGALTFGNSSVSSNTILTAATLADYGAPVVSAGIDNTTAGYQQFQQAGSIYKEPVKVLGGESFDTFGADFYTCLSFSQCNYSESSIRILAAANGLTVNIVNGASDAYTFVIPQLAGFSVPGVGDKEESIFPGTKRTYFIPATIDFNQTSSVPEPKAWTLMLAALASIGAALRRRRASSPAPRVAGPDRRSDGSHAAAFS